MFEVNQKELAAALGISARQVRNLRNEQGMFPFIPGTKKYNLTACNVEYIKFKVEEETGRGTNTSKEKEAAEHERYKKELTLEKLRAVRKQTHKAKDVEEFLNNMLTNFRSHILAVPAKVAPLVLNESDVNVIVKTLEDEMYAVLDELCEYDPDAVNGNVPDYLEDDEDEPEE